MLFRNRRVVQAMACYLLLQTTSSLLFPTISLAMMGPSQPEFVSYDAPGATDMVDLATGDFSYRLPVLDVPGPERSFSLPLAYSAGIQLEQEASWVGLGWTLNPGAIARSVNGYPDDANADQISTTFYKDIQHGWTGGIPGVLDLGWNSISGHSGAVNFLGLQGYTWDEDGISSSETVGITQNYRTGEIKADPAKMASAAATIASLGTVPPSAVGATIGNQIAGTVIGTAAQGSLGGTVGFNNQPIREVSNHTFNQDYWDYYNTSSTESAFGSLWFGNMSVNAIDDQNAQNTMSPSYGPDIYATPQASSATKAKLFAYQRQVNQTLNGKKANITSETAADIYQDGSDKTTDDVGTKYINADGRKYRESGRRPISIAHDNFRVMGENVTGSIRPYRLDMGNVAYPKLGVSLSNLPSYTDYNGIQHYKYAAVPFLSPSIYRPGFRYENSISNDYTYHKYTPASGNEAVGFNINPATNSSATTSLTITDPRLDITAGNRVNTAIEPARKGLHNSFDSNTYASDMQLVHGRHVKWYSNRDILNMTRNPGSFPNNSFLEFGTAGTSSSGGYGGNYRTFRANLPPEGIGAFAVTAEDGTTYHYSLPVYQFQTYQEANELTPDVGGPGKSTRREGTQGLPKWGNAFSTYPSGARATAWLLTAITSADYIDRNNSGTVDANDWGGWVRFDYGLFSSQYKWRQPYIGNSYSDEEPTIRNQGFTEGYKQTYYLNAISTRSHTALFIKSVRQDGRGHFNPAVTASSSNLGIDERVPASTLRLDEIILLDNATLSKLNTAGGINDPSDPNQIPALTTATSAQFGPYTDGPMNGAGDIMDNVFDGHDLDGDSRIRKFVEANALKRVRFNYDYDLCRGVSNSFSCLSNAPSTLPPMDEANCATNRGGKLTLKSVSFYGPTVNNTLTKIIPDFTFSYEKPNTPPPVTNPTYARDRWDAFGMYNSAGRYDVASHRPQQSDYAAPWTLTQITDPLGGTTEITYERDDYAHVSEFGTTRIHLNSSGCSAYSVTTDANFKSPLTSVIKQGQTIYLTGVISYTTNFNQSYTKNYKNFPVQVETVSASQLTLTDATNPALQLGVSCTTIKSSALDAVLPNNVVGGDVRVAAITTKDGANAYQTRYKYTVSAASENAGFNSAGVLAQEPPFLKRFDQPFYGVADYPVTPILYSQVSVLSGRFNNNSDDDYTTKQVYSFFTPTSDMVRDNNPQWKPATTYSTPNGSAYIPVVVADNQTVIDIGKVGQLQKIEFYNHQGQQELATSFTYSSAVPNADGISNQGHYTEGLLNNERVESEYRINRSTKEYLPTVMTGSRTTRKGVSTSVSNVLYDFYTGQVLETTSTSSLGKVSHFRAIPAYTLPSNTGMGAKGDNATNKHMLVQVGASYAYTEVPGGPAYDPLNPLNPATSHVLAASVQTWQSNWTNYREADASGTYQDVAGQQPVWRQAATYTWQSPVLDTDGSFKNFSPFNWSGTSDSHWLKAGESVRYDHFSHAVEARDVNGSYAAQKTGYNQTQLIASASNARYTEVAYSGAEDQLTVAGATHFGGEVVAAGGTVVSAPAPTHTGFFSLQLAGGQKGFVYRAQAGRDMSVGKTYRVSAWANANATSGKLYASLNGSRLAESSLTSATTKKAGAWYLLSLLVTIPASATGQTLEFGCANDGAAAANFDDFRVAPLVSAVTSRVYDPRSNRLLYSLDNDNLFTHYEYTSTGRLKRVYQETFDGTSTSNMAEHLVKEYEFNYARLQFPTWVTTTYRCVLDGQGNYTGYEERQVVDVNPLNNPPTPSKWESNGGSVSCTPPPCPYTDSNIPYRLRNNQWEQAQSTGSAVCQPCGQNGHFFILHWVYSNGDNGGDTYTACQSGACGSEQQQF